MSQNIIIDTYYNDWTELTSKIRSNFCIYIEDVSSS